MQRATLNIALDDFILSRDNKSFPSKTPTGRTFYSYGRSFYRAGIIRLYGRIHIDQSHTFILSEPGFDGLIEIARTCRVLLHTAARNSIGSSMPSLLFHQAIKDDVLIPRNKSIPEAFKTAYELLVRDRGGFVFEPRVGAHNYVGEVDFSSMYLVLMAMLLERALLILNQVDCHPEAIREDISTRKKYPDLLYSASELLDRAADLSSQFAVLIHDNERKWRIFRQKVEKIILFQIKKNPNDLLNGT